MKLKHLIQWNLQTFFHNTALICAIENDYINIVKHILLHPRINVNTNIIYILFLDKIKNKIR